MRDPHRYLEEENSGRENRKYTESEAGPHLLSLRNREKSNEVGAQ